MSFLREAAPDVVRSVLPPETILCCHVEDTPDGRVFQTCRRAIYLAPAAGQAA